MDVVDVVDVVEVVVEVVAGSGFVVIASVVDVVSVLTLWDVSVRVGVVTVLLVVELVTELTVEDTLEVVDVRGSITGIASTINTAVYHKVRANKLSQGCKIISL